MNPDPAEFSRKQKQPAFFPLKEMGTRGNNTKTALAIGAIWVVIPENFSENVEHRIAMLGFHPVAWRKLPPLP